MPYQWTPKIETVVSATLRDTRWLAEDGTPSPEVELLPEVNGVRLCTGYDTIELTAPQLDSLSQLLVNAATTLRKMRNEKEVFP